MSHRCRALAPLALALVLAAPTAASAQASLVSGFGGVVGYGTQCLSRNDDGSSAPIDITPFFPAGLRFFDQTHTSVYVNTNGNITFSGRVSTYTPTSFPIAAQPMIAPFWGDVDIRNYPSSCMGSAGVTCTVCTPCHNPTENGVWWHLEPGRMIVTWDRVGHYSCENGERNSFQLILTAVAGCGGAGDFDVEFRYNRCEWEAGSASGDTNDNGICDPGESTCTPAQAGFDAGNTTDFVSIMGSLMTGIHTNLCSNSNVGMPGVWQFQIRGGAIQCPDAGDACDTGMVGVCAAGRTNCVGMGTECVQEVESAPERCDALDNDCDGMVDEGDMVCGADEVCEMGNCLAACFELGCPAGETCLPSGRCVDAMCVDVTCPEGQRCEMGACVGACDGVVCPVPLACRGGRCVDPCAGLTCDDCTICDDGTCILSCEYEPCMSGETCQMDGSCLEDACVGVTCPAGEYCMGGSCVDSCAGAVCPDGEMCEMGMCVPEVIPDAGPPPTPDAGPPAEDAGTGGPMDAGVEMDAGDGRAPPDVTPGCDCTVKRDTHRSPIGLGLGVVLLGLLAYRRRRRERRDRSDD